MQNPFRRIYLLSEHIVKSEGFTALLVRAYRRIFKSQSNKISLASLLHMTKINILSFYDFVLTPDKPAELAHKSDIHANTINWFIPDFGIGSGGHLNIFRFIFMLEKKGYKNTICLIGQHRHSSPEQAQALIQKHFFHLEAKVVFSADDLPDAQHSFATSWITAYALRGFSRTVHKLYFVQDFEPAFYAFGSEYAFAEETYKFGFVGVCAGDWLSTVLKDNYGMTCHTLGFSYDRDLYQPTPRREPQTLRVFCYCRPPTLRRGLETALLTLNIVGQRLPQAKFIFAGWDMSNYYFPHEHLNAGLVSLAELPDLYSQCDVALVISFTNLSLLPLELMACGCAVVSNSGPNVEWLLNKDNCMLSNASPVDIADAIVKTLENTEARTKLTKNAKQFAQSTSWENEGEKLSRILEDLVK